MLNLTYHPVNDPYHCAFRTLRLLTFHSDQVHKEALFSLLDFYLLFPFLMSRIHMTRELRTTFHRLTLDRIVEPYQKLPDQRRLFWQVEIVQREAYRNLAAAEILDIREYGQGFISLGPQPLGTKLLADVRKVNEANKAHIRFLLDHLGQIPLYGPDGLKSRTGLLEYRYDAPQP